MRVAIVDNPHFDTFMIQEWLSEDNCLFTVTSKGRSWARTIRQNVHGEQEVGPWRETTQAVAAYRMRKAQGFK